jgi:hypothetical protein
MARCHRIGQTKTVTVYRTVCQDTAEEQMLTRIQKKLYLSMKVCDMILIQFKLNNIRSPPNLKMQIKSPVSALKTLFQFFVTDQLSLGVILLTRTVSRPRRLTKFWHSVTCIRRRLKNA